jgi:histone-lysine N-methyltransferase SETMAR
MDEQKIHIHHCMLYEFDRGSMVAEATKNIHAAYGEEAVGSSTCYRWFSKFRSEDTTLTDKPRSGRPVDFDDEALQALLDADPRQTTRELAEQLNCHHSTVERHLHALGKVQSPFWIELSLEMKNGCVMSTCVAEGSGLILAKSHFRM